MPQFIQRSFTSGEIAPALQARSDLVKYSTGLHLCQNFFVKSQGGVYSRPGTRFIGEIGDSTKRARLIPFQFNTEQTYILVFEEFTMRVVKDGAFVEASPGVIYELVTTYTEDELPRLAFTQSADVMTLVHVNHDPANLGRLADNNWTLTDIDYTPPSAPSAPVLSATGTGAGTYSKTYTYVVTWVDGNGVESLPSALTSITTPSLTVTAGVNINWPSVVGSSYYRVYKDSSDTSGVYGWIGDSTLSDFKDFNIAPLLSDAPPANRDPFSGADNKPAAVNYFQQRQIFAQTTNEPQVMYTTQVANYNSMRTSSPSRSDDAVTLTIAGRQVNEIRHIVSLDSLLLLTSGGEWRVTEGQDQVLTPSTVGVRPQSYNGSSWVPPVVINSTVVYVQEKGARIRDMTVGEGSSNFTGSDLSLMSEHLFDKYEIEEMAYADEPYGILWCVRNDGKLLGLTYQREHQVYGWHQHDTDGLFESVASISEDQRDAVYFVVNRTIDGVEKRYVERLEPRGDTSALDMFYVDSGLTYDGVPADNLSGLDHLEGETVTILADGNELVPITVESGSITLPAEYSTIHVGLPYTPAIETLYVDTGEQGQTLKSVDLSVSKLFLELERSRGGWVGPRSTDVQNNITFDMTEIKPRYDADFYNPIQPKTYIAEAIVDDHWDKSGAVRIEQRSPLPLSILSVIPDIDVGGN